MGTGTIRPLASACLVSLLAAFGCARESVRLDEGLREYVSSDYERVLQRWTRTERLLKLDELDNVLEVSATYEAWDFRWAYVVRYAEDYRLSIDQRHILLERSLAETRDEHQFFVALYAQRQKWGDLNRENPAWIVRLIDDLGTETIPVEIVEIKDPGAIEHTYFPYTSPWRWAYRIHFPVLRADGRRTISKHARWFGLRFTGPQGHEELVWQLEPGGAYGAPGSIRTPVPAADMEPSEPNLTKSPTPG